MPLLRSFLNLLAPRTDYRADQPALFQIDETYLVTGVGTVVAGTMLAGAVRTNDTLLLGPDTVGDFHPATIRTIQRRRMVVDEVRAGQTASFALKKVKRGSVRKGMVMAAAEPAPRACMEFAAEILVLHHPTTIGVHYQAMVHCGSVRQTASIVHMDQPVIRTGDRATVRFRFLKHPEYLAVGGRLVFREGRTKAVGSVTRVDALDGAAAGAAPDAQPDAAGVAP